MDEYEFTKTIAYKYLPIFYFSSVEYKQDNSKFETC